MSPAKRVLSGTSAGIIVSTLVHATLASTLYYGLVLRKPAPIVAELDLSMVPLVPMAPNLGGGSGAKPAETWTVPKNAMDTVPQPPPFVETKEEVQNQESQNVLCSECPQNPTTDMTGWGYGSGEGEGQYVPAEQAARKPRWIKKFITSQDYPLVARQQGKDGRVVMMVLIDSSGHVRDARLTQGSYEALNEVALRKVKEAIFSPAYDKNNQPISCKVTLPIRFELR